MNCLRTGGECGYPDPFVSFAGSSTDVVPRSESHPARRTGQTVIKSDRPLPSHTGQAPQNSCSLLDMTPKDSLTGLMLSGPQGKLPTMSRWLFHTCEYTSLKTSVSGLEIDGTILSCSAEHSRSSRRSRAKRVLRVCINPCLPAAVF
jgi:hypothetical protein